LKRKALKLLRFIFFAIGIFIIYFIGQKTGWDKTFNALMSINIYQILFITLLPIAWILLHSGGWALLFDERKIFNFKHILGAQISSMALSELLPLGQAGGEPYRIYFVRKYYPREKSPNIIASVILYNTIHTVATIIIIFIGFITLISNISVNQKKKYAFLIAICLGALMLFLFIQKQKKGFMGPLFEFLSKIKLFRNFAQKKKEKAYIVDEKLTTFYRKHRPSFYISLFIILIAKLIGVIEIYAIMSFISQPLGFEDSLILFSATSLVQILFFFFPSQVGASEGSIVYMAKALGQSTAGGMALAIIRRARLIVWTLIGWIIAHFFGPKLHDFK